MRRALVLILCIPLAAAGCEVEDDAYLPGDAYWSEDDAGVDPPDTAPEHEADASDDGQPSERPDNPCVNEGDPGNEYGVGAWCTPGGGECDLLANASFCTVDLRSDSEVWACTRACLDDDECGSDARCWQLDGDASRCLPTRCFDESAQ